jgi:putative restriction endonuclease
MFEFVEAFEDLATHKVGEVKTAYKPALLLAVLEGLETGSITGRQIHITPDLISAFRKFHTQLGASQPYRLRHFIYPFVYLQGEKLAFWHLKDKTGKLVTISANDEVTSMTKLLKLAEYAELSLSLWSVLQKAEWRKKLQNALLSNYF